MFVVLAPDYPSPENPSVNAFVHSRILSYKQQGTEVAAFVVTGAGGKTQYEYDGVPVYRGSPEDFARWKELALAKGFRHVASAPLARSSYKAGEALEDVHDLY